jgi:hypothetical protein
LRTTVDDWFSWPQILTIDSERLTNEESASPAFSYPLPEMPLANPTGFVSVDGLEDNFPVAVESQHNAMRNIKINT